MKTLLMTVVMGTVALMVGQNAQACWAAPEPIVWQDGDTEAYEYKRDNKAGVITVYAKGDRENPLWSAKLAGFSSLFSHVSLVANGTKIVHIRSNHQVSTLEEGGVSVYTAKGVTHHKVKEFVKEIAKPKPGAMRVSTDPGRYWLKKVTEVTASKVVLVSHDGKTHTLDI